MQWSDVQAVAADPNDPRTQYFTKGKQLLATAAEHVPDNVRAVYKMYDDTREERIQLWEETMAFVKDMLAKKMIKNGVKHLQIDPFLMCQFMDVTYATPEVPYEKMEQDFNKKRSPLAEAAKYIAHEQYTPSVSAAAVKATSFFADAVVELRISPVIRWNRARAGFAEMQKNDPKLKSFQVVHVDIDVVTFFDIVNHVYYICIAGTRRLSDWVGRDGNAFLTTGVMDLKRVSSIYNSFQKIATHIEDGREYSASSVVASVVFVGHSRAGWFAETYGIDLGFNYVNINGPSAISDTNEPTAAAYNAAVQRRRQYGFLGTYMQHSYDLVGLGKGGLLSNQFGVLQTAHAAMKSASQHGVNLYNKTANLFKLRGLSREEVADEVLEPLEKCPPNSQLWRFGIDDDDTNAATVNAIAGGMKKAWSAIGWLGSKDAATIGSSIKHAGVNVATGATVGGSLLGGVTMGVGAPLGAALGAVAGGVYTAAPILSAISGYSGKTAAAIAALHGDYHGTKKIKEAIVAGSLVYVIVGKDTQELLYVPQSDEPVAFVPRQTIKLSKRARMEEGFSGSPGPVDAATADVGTGARLVQNLAMAAAANEMAARTEEAEQD